MNVIDGYGCALGECSTQYNKFGCASGNPILIGAGNDSVSGATQQVATGKGASSQTGAANDAEWGIAA